MLETDQIDEDEVLRRMLTTPPAPHKPLGKRRRVAKPECSKVRWLVACLIVAATPALAQPLTPSRTGPTMVYGLQPPPSCGKWTAARALRDIEAAQLQMWLLGFVTAFNLYAPAANGDVANGADVEALYGWMDQHCRSNPLNDLTAATVELIRQLEARRAGRR